MRFLTASTQAAVSDSAPIAQNWSSEPGLGFTSQVPNILARDQIHHVFTDVLAMVANSFQRSGMVSPDIFTYPAV